MSGSTPRKGTMTSSHTLAGSAPIACALLLSPFPVCSCPDGQVPSAQEDSLSVLFTIPEHDLYPENVAFDPVSGDYFLGSMGQSRILRIHGDGSYEDFTRGLEPVLQSSVGMKVDPRRRRLWVCSGRYTVFGGATDAPPQTGVLLFDLDEGTLLKSWMMDQPSPGHIFNDLALTAEGDVYATTTLLGKIYRLSEGSDEMELILDRPGSQTNGITLGSSGRYLFFTLDRTISRMDLATAEVLALEVPEGADVGTDGLYFVDGSLISVKPRWGQILRLRLNDALDSADGVELLAGANPDFAYPTTGVLVGDHLVFVATSFADVPRNPDSARQHDDVLIYRLGVR